MKMPYLPEVTMGQWMACGIAGVILVSPIFWAIVFSGSGLAVLGGLALGAAAGLCFIYGVPRSNLYIAGLLFARIIASFIFCKLGFAFVNLIFDAACIVGLILVPQIRKSFGT